MQKECWKNLRHNYLNDLIYHTLLQTGLPSTTKSARLLRTDGKRPDGLINVPWQAGKWVAWDATVANTLADFY